MAVNQKDVNDAKGTLLSDETIYVTARQRSFGPGMAVINPTVVIATSKRLILINRTTLGMRKDIESIPYDRITSVRFENGLISASIYMRIEGYTSQQGETGFIKPGTQEGEIYGLTKADAKALSDVLNRMVMRGTSDGQVPTAQSQPQATPGAQVKCKKCGAMNGLNDKFCGACGAKLK